jgi:hypothetical protein
MRPRVLHGLVAGGALLVAACGAGSATDRDADSALARDLTLASSTARPTLDSAVSLGGDTAAAAPASVAPAARPAARPAPAPVAVRRAEPAPPRRAPTRRPAAAAPAAVAAAPAAAAAPGDAADGAPRDAPGDAATGPAAGTGAGRSIAAGTLLAGSLGQRVCTESNRPGDRFVAVLGGEVTGTGGATLPAGTPIVLELARASTDPPSVEFVVRGVSVGGEFVPVVAEAQPVTGEVERREVVDKAGSSKSKAVQGAIAGAILGRVLGGGGKSTVIGAAGGAAAGAAMGRGRSHEESCLTAGAPVRVRLAEALAVR